MNGTSSPKWRRYLRFWTANVAADVDDELAFHVDARTQELCDAGLDYAAARRQALGELGDVDRLRLTLRSMDERHALHERRADWLAGLALDVRVSLRALRRSPGLVAVVAITFALGIGMTSAIYSLVDAFLFRPLPGTHGAELVVIGRTDRELPQPHEVSYPDFRDFRADTAVFASLAAFSSRIVELNGDRGADRIFVDDATANYFDVMGLRPILGRTFVHGEDDGVLAHPIIVLAYKAWQAHFAGDSSIVGRVIRINEHPVTVIGVLPPDFHGVRPIVDLDGVTPLNQVWPGYGKALEDRAAFDLTLFGRLRPGVSLARAREAVRLTAMRIEREYPATNKGVGVVLVAERYSRPSITISNITPALAGVFMTLVVLVLLVACANVASLLLARVIVRGRELAIRLSLGASQWSLVRQVMVECALLATLGGAAAVAVAYAAIKSVDSIHVATDLPIRWGVQFDARIVAFTIVATVLAAIVAGVAPALAARKRNLNELLKSSVGNSATRSHQRLRSILVAGQMAISVVVLICAGLFMRSSAAASRMQLGFRGDHIALLSTALRAQRYDSTQGLALYGELVRRTAAIPGVQAVALTKYVPFGFDRDNINVFPIASAVQVPPNGFGYRTNVISGDYFTAMGIPLFAGRSFTDRDNQTAQQVAIVNDALANTLWHGQPTLGKRVRVGSATGPLLEIVGVARGAQDMIPGETPQPTLYRPLGQSYRADMTLIVQTSAEPSSLVPTLRSTIASLDPSLPIFDVRTMAEHLQNGQAFLFTRIGTAFASVFGLLALVLATVGVYGVVSYSVAQRTREIGVRVALGAGLTSILGLVVRQGLMLAWIGGAIGLVLSFTTTGVLSSILYGVGPRDPVVLGVVLGGLTIVAALASFVPARRAAQIDPIKALRAE